MPVATMTSVDLMITITGSPGARSKSGGGVFGDRRGQWLTVTEHRFDRGHHLAVMHLGERGVELVAGAEPQLWLGRCLTLDRVECLVEETAHGAGALSSPQVDEVVVGMGGGEDVDGRFEQLSLHGQQRLVVEPGAAA